MKEKPEENAAKQRGWWIYPLLILIALGFAVAQLLKHCVWFDWSR